METLKKTIDKMESIVLGVATAIGGVLMMGETGLVSMAVAGVLGYGMGHFLGKALPPTPKYQLE